MDYPHYTRRPTANQVAVDADTLGIEAQNVQDALRYLLERNVPTVGGSGPIRVELRTITEQEAADNALMLSVAIADYSNVAFDIMGGVAQLLGYDFTVSAARVDWGMGELADLLTAGDVVRLIYTAVPEYKIIYVTLSEAMIAAKEVALPLRASYPDQVVVDVIGGCSQFYGVDYTCDGLKLSWSGLDLETLLDSGDHIRIAFLG